MVILHNHHLWRVIVAAALLAGQGAQAAINLDINSVESIKNAAATAAYGMMSYYNGNQSGQTPGTLPGTWWEGGAMFMTLIQYWHWTGDTSYNEVTAQGMLWQAGQDANYMPANSSEFEGNDDQVFWGFAAMTAAELNFPDVSNQPSWLSLAQAVFNTQAARWDNSSCGGGLRWQLNPYQSGYDLKNAISNGGFFQLAARLAYFTGNQTYADWAIKMWDWCATTPLLMTSNWTIDDTTSVESNCQDYDILQWTYNYGTFLMGAAYLYNHTNGSSTWNDAVNGLLGTIFEVFFPQQYGGNIMSEVACEGLLNCNRNHITFKTFLSTWLGFTALLVPETKGQIITKLQASAQGAANQCSGGPNGTACGIRWYQKTWDGQYGMEEEMSALGVFSANLVTQDRIGPLTASTGGTSKSDPGAGSLNIGPGATLKKITTGDRLGAGVLTALFPGVLVGMIVWLLRE